ncbi:hypothetical protein L9F63_024132, partial [Diploptera punctata]
VKSRCSLVRKYIPVKQTFQQLQPVCYCKSRCSLVRNKLICNEVYAHTYITINIGANEVKNNRQDILALMCRPKSHDAARRLSEHFNSSLSIS